MKFGYVSWLPQTELVEKFAAELRNNRLMGTRCERCGQRYVPPRSNCRCGSSEMEWFEAPKQGRLVSYIHVNFAPESMSKFAPYTLGVVDLGDGQRILGHITGVTPATLKIGMILEAVSHQPESDRIVYKFRPM